MKKKLSELKAPALAGVVRAQSERAVLAAMKNCDLHGADMIDLHLSCLAQTDLESLKRMLGASRLPVLALHYNRTYDWGDAGASEEQRVELLLRAVEAGAAGIDLQGYTFDLPSRDGFCGSDRYSFTRGNPKEIVTDPTVIERQCDLIERVHSMGAEVLLSCHPGIAMTMEQVVELALFLEKRKPDILKIVTFAECEADLAECQRTMLALKKEVKTPIAYHTFGAAGIPSRILNPLLGGQIAFCVDGYDEASTMEQIDLQTARKAVDAVRRLV